MTPSPDQLLRMDSLARVGVITWRGKSMSLAGCQTLAFDSENCLKLFRRTPKRPRQSEWVNQQ
jgi:hypothetical protein